MPALRVVRITRATKPSKRRMEKLLIGKPFFIVVLFYPVGGRAAKGFRWCVAFGGGLFVDVLLLYLNAKFWKQLLRGEGRGVFYLWERWV